MLGSKNRETLAKRIGLLAGALGLSLWLNALPAFAAGTVSVSASKDSVGVSDQVTVNVATSEPEDPATPPQISVTYNTDLLKFESCDVEYGGGEGGLITMTGTGGSITFTALAAGDASVSAEAVIDGDGNNPATGSASIAVGGAAAAPAGEDAAAQASAAGSNATLKALAIEPGVLSPAFTPENTQYTITIPEGVTDITVSGGPSDPNAQITSASGFKGLGDGDSDASIVVTLGDNTVEYHFHIVRGDVEAAQAALAAETPAAQEAAPDAQQADADTKEGGLSAGFGLGEGFSKSSEDAMTILVGQNSYAIQPVIADALMPQGAAKTSISYAGTTIEAVQLSGSGLTLVDAKSNIDGSEKLFIYDAASDSFQGFVVISGVNGSYIVPVALPQSLPKGFVAEGTDIGGSYIACGKLRDSSVQQRENVCLLYAVDANGSPDYYLYDLSGGGYVHFLNTGASGGSATGFSKRAIAIIVILAVMLFLSLIIMLVMALKKGEDVTLLGDDEDEDDYDPYEEERERPRRKPQAAPAKRPAPETVRTAPAKKRRPPVREAYDYEEEDEEDFEEPYEEAPVRPKAPARRPAPRPAPAREEAEEDGEERSSMPEPTVKKVRKTRRVERPVYESDGDDNFDIDRELAAMKENAIRTSATARMVGVEQTLKKQGSARPVSPESADPAAGQVRPRRPVTSSKAREITADGPRKRPAPGTTRTVRPQTAEEAETVRKPKVTKKVTEKGVTYTTGKIPITVVEAAKPADEGAKSAVPIITLDEEAPAPSAPAPRQEAPVQEIVDETVTEEAAAEDKN